MAEQQLIDYITKAKEAGQTEDQTRTLLYKNGWTEVEVGEAFSSIATPQVSAKLDVPTEVSSFKPPIDKVVVEPQLEAQDIINSTTSIRPQSQTESWSSQPQPQLSEVTMQSDMPQRKKKSHIISKIFITLIILVVLGGAGYFAAGQYFSLPFMEYFNLSFIKNFNFPWNPLNNKPKPELVIQDMVKNMQNVKSYNSVIKMEFDAMDNTTKASQGKLTLDINGSMDRTDAQNIKANSNLVVNFTMSGSASSAFAFDANLISIGETSYLKINNITLPNDASLSGLDISKINGKWFQIDQDSVRALSELESESSSAVAITQASNSDLVKKINDLITAESIFSNVSQLDDEVISGQDTYHYLSTISKDKLKDLVNKIMELVIQESVKAQPQVEVEIPNPTSVATAPPTSTIVNTTPDISNSFVQDMMQAVVGAFMDAIGDINMEMWIGQKDSMLYQSKINKTIDLSKMSLSGDIMGPNVSLSFKFSDTNSNFNVPITVQAPEGAQKIEEVLIPILKMQKIKSDLAEIGSIGQSVFSVNDSYSSLCARGLLNGYLANYGDNLISLNNNMLDNGSKKTACFASTQSYCVSTQLADGTYLCVGGSSVTDCTPGIDCIGSTVLGTTRCISSRTVCK